MTRRGALLAVVATLAVGGVAAGGSIATVTINDTASGFQPAAVTLRVGEVVRWENDDSVAHRTRGKRAGGTWNFLLAPGGSRQRSFHHVGRFPYLCTIHPSMKGVVRVPISMDSSTFVGQPTILRVASVSAPSGFRYRIQRKRPGGTWKLWRVTTAKTTSWTPKAGAVGEWRFRARTQRISTGAVSGWSPVRRIVVTKP
jgi:plastocyanin